MNFDVRVLIADDHPLIRSGLRQMITSESGFECAGEASDGHDALAMIRDTAPDIAIIDIDMPRMNGFDVARAVRQERLPTDLIVLTMYREEDMFNAAMDLGVRGYVLKDSVVTDILACLRNVARGKCYFSPRITADLGARTTRVGDLLRTKPELDALTPTERKILAQIADQKTTREIAETMFASPKTVENHRTNISAKLNLRGSHSLMKFAIAHKAELASP